MHFLDNYKLKLLLKKIEGKIKIDLGYLVRNGFWVGFGIVLANVFSFLSAIAFANLLDQKPYGIFKYVISISSIFYVFTLSGMTTAVLKSVARGFEGVFVKALKMRVRWGFLGALGLAALSSYYFINGDKTLGWAFLLSAPFAPFMDSLLLFNSYLGGKKDFRKQTEYSNLINIGATIAMVCTLFITKNLFIILAVYFLSYTLLRWFFYLKTLKLYRPNNLEEGGTLNYGKHLSLMDGINIIAGNIDKFLIFHFVGAAELAIYSFATIPVMRMKIITKTIKPLMLPRFANRSKEELRGAIWRKMWMLFLVLALATVFYFVLAPIFFKIFFPKYLAAVGLSRIVALSLIFGIDIIPRSILQTHNRTKELYFLNIFESVANIIMLFVATFFWGVWGLVWSGVILRALVFAATYYLTEKYLSS